MEKHEEYEVKSVFTTMDPDEIYEKIASFQKGSVHRISYVKRLQTRKNVTDLVEKVSTIYGKFGVSYDNIQKVIMARANGELPAQNAGLRGVHWMKGHEGMYLVSDTTGAVQVRITRNPPEMKMKSQTQYFINGQEVKKEEAEKLCTKKDFPTYDPDKKPSPVLDLGIDKIIALK